MGSEWWGRFAVVLFVALSAENIRASVEPHPPLPPHKNLTVRKLCREVFTPVRILPKTPTQTFNDLTELEEKSTDRRTFLGEPDTAVKITSRSALVRLETFLRLGRLEQAEEMDVDGDGHSLRRVFRDTEVASVQLINNMQRILHASELIVRYPEKQKELAALVKEAWSEVQAWSKKFGPNYYYYNDIVTFLNWMKMEAPEDRCNQRCKELISTLLQRVGVLDPIARAAFFSDHDPYVARLAALGVKAEDFAQVQFLDWATLSAEDRHDEEGPLGRRVIGELACVPFAQMGIQEHAHRCERRRTWRRLASTPIFQTLVLATLNKVPWLGHKITNVAQVKAFFQSITDYRAYYDHYPRISNLVSDWGDLHSKLVVLGNMTAANQMPDLLVTFCRRQDLYEFRKKLKDYAQAHHERYEDVLVALEKAEKEAKSIGPIAADYQPPKLNMAVNAVYTGAVLYFAYLMKSDPEQAMRYVPFAR